MKQLLEVKDRIDLTSEPLPIWQVRLLIPQPIASVNRNIPPTKKTQRILPWAKLIKLTCIFNRQLMAPEENSASGD
jgi:hypothetical protein